jgi:hypothetical protein
LEQLRKCKSIYNQWVNTGKPQNHPLKQQLISEKRNLRRQQKLEKVIAKNRLYDQPFMFINFVGIASFCAKSIASVILDFKLRGLKVIYVLEICCNILIIQIIRPDNGTTKLSTFL